MLERLTAWTLRRAGTKHVVAHNQWSWSRVVVRNNYSYRCSTSSIILRTTTTKNYNTTVKNTNNPTRNNHNTLALAAAPGWRVDPSTQQQQHPWLSTALSPQRRCLTTTTTSDQETTNTLTPFLLADIGEGIKEVELLQWYVVPGDVVQQFDKICEVQSDKATVEITSRYDGIVVQLAGEPGSMLQVGQPLLYLRQEQQQDSTTTSGSSALHPPNADTPTLSFASGYNMLQDTTLSLTGEQRLSIPTVASQFHLRGDDDDDDVDPVHHHAHHFQASPAVRKLGREYGLDVSTIKGTGPAGRVLKTDVITYLQELGRWKGPTAHEQQSSDSTAGTMSGTGAAASGQPPPIAAVAEQDEIIQLRGYSRMMVKSMTAALQTPHMCFGDEVNVDALMETRIQLNNGLLVSSATTMTPTKISLLALLVKAVSCALTDHPAVNSVVHNVDECSILQRRDHNIGIAMDTVRGLVVPVIRQCQIKSVTEISAALEQFKTIAGTTGKFAADDLADATFTVSNIGSVGAGTYMQPVLAPPALAMGALGRVKTLPRYRRDSTTNDLLTDEIYPASILTVTWAADHRFLDGATLGRFHCSFQRYVEHPVTMLARLK
jgi:2-oxoisovalerate dehydrogenase E2 component (dihydrolipoyl transacylase)